MAIGSGCKVHLADSELPFGRLVVSVSKHYTAVIDGVVHDTHDPAWPDRYGAALGAFAISAGDCSL